MIWVYDAAVLPYFSLLNNAHAMCRVEVLIKYQSLPAADGEAG